MNPSSQATDPQAPATGDTTSDTWTSSPAELLSAAPDAASVRAARVELMAALSAVAVFSALLSGVVGIRVFHMAVATEIGIVFSLLISILFALAILLGMGLLVRMHSRGNFLGEQLPVLRAVVQETYDRGVQLKEAVRQDLEGSVLLEENTRAVLTGAQETYTREFHTHLAGLQAAAQVLGLDQLPPPARFDIVAMSQPIREDVEPRLATAEARRQDIKARLDAIVLTDPEAPTSPHVHSYAGYPGKPDFDWVDASVLPEGFAAGIRK